jgi:hypothetical protein
MAHGQGGNCWKQQQESLARKTFFTDFSEGAVRNPADSVDRGQADTFVILESKLLA